MNEGEYYAMFIRLVELKQNPEINQDYIKYLESKLETVNINNLRGDSIG